MWDLKFRPFVSKPDTAFGFSRWNGCALCLCLLGNSSPVRLPIIAVPVLLSATGFFGLVLQPHSSEVLLALFTVASIGSSYLPVLWSIPTEYLSKSAAAAAVGMINALGSIPGFFGPYLFGYLSTKTESFTLGLAVLMSTALTGGLLIFCLPNRGRSESKPSCL